MGVRECKKIIVVGNAGSGKTTFATRLSEILGLPLIHLDKEYWRPGWRETPREAWLEKHKSLIEKDEWIIDGTYGVLLKERFLEADAVMFMDISRPVCYFNIIRRRLKYNTKVRPDMPEDCPEFIRPDQLKKIWYFPHGNRNRIMNYMMRYPREEMHTFYTMEAANEWLDKLAEKVEKGKEDKENA